MGRANTETKKSESATGRYVMFCKRRANLFKKAHELAVLCDAEVAIILFSADGKISEFASSDMQSILRRLHMCLESRNRPALEFKPEDPEEQVTEEVDALRQEDQELKLKQWRLLGKDLSQMGLHELRVLEKRLTEGMLHIKDRKMQILMEQLEQSKMQEQWMLQKNQALQSLVEELQGFRRTTSYPLPLSFHFPETEGNVRPADGKILLSTSFAAPLVTNNGPETKRKVGPADKGFFPSIASVAPLASDDGSKTECNGESADEDSDTMLALSRLPTGVGPEDEDTRE